MGAFADQQELLNDFLIEAGEMLAELDSKLIMLEKMPDDTKLINEVFRSFHTIKGGAGFLGVNALVDLCHHAENVLDLLRKGDLQLNPEIMDAVLASTRTVNEMFACLRVGEHPPAADASLIQALETASTGRSLKREITSVTSSMDSANTKTHAQALSSAAWKELYEAVSVQVPTTVRIEGMPQPKATSPRAIPADTAVKKENTIRVDTERLDSVLTLSGEIGLVNNRLKSLRRVICDGLATPDTPRALDEAVGQLDQLISTLQNAVMKTRMQPIGRLFQKYPRLVRDVARQLGKDVELVLSGEETEIDKTLLEDLNDPLVHLLRNAVDHGVEPEGDRIRAGKSAKALVRLSARQEGDHVLIEITDDGKGMNAEVLRQKAIEKGLLRAEDAAALSERECLELVFLPGFSTKEQISDISGRGVGMDVVKTNINRLNGYVVVESTPGVGTTFRIALPLTMAILPVLQVRLADQTLALPLSLVREILPIQQEALQIVKGRETMVVRGEVLPVLSLASLLGWRHSAKPAAGVVTQLTGSSFILAVDGFAGRDDVVIKSLETFQPEGVAGATMSSDGEIVLILDIKKLMDMASQKIRGTPREMPTVKLAA
jgi:two-component system, chemotaxis family, sensor kinase CheA